jgi:hypothetical protein
VSDLLSLGGRGGLSASLQVLTIPLLLEPFLLDVLIACLLARLVLLRLSYHPEFAAPSVASGLLLERKGLVEKLQATTQSKVVLSRILAPRLAMIALQA